MTGHGSPRRATDWAGNIAAFVIVVAANFLANAVPLGGQTTGEISAKYPSLFTPAGFTFAIWGLIYGALALFVCYQALPAQRRNGSIARISGWFKANCAGNALWIFAWHYDFLWTSLVLMAVILVTLIAMYDSLGIVDRYAPAGERWLMQLPIGMYTAWISVASIANISAVQVAMGWDDVGLDVVTWTQLKIALAAVIAATVIARRGDRLFVLVIGWAAYGISVSQAATPAIAGAATSVVFLALLLVAVETGRKIFGR